MIKNRGMTLTEVMAAVAVFSIIALVMSILITMIFKGSTDFKIQAQAHSGAIIALRKLETRLVHANEILTAGSDEIMFIADINTWPDFPENADWSGNGVENYLDPDIDGDAAEYAISSGNVWKVGYNLYDDDSTDNDTIDMRWRIYLEDGKIKCDYSKDEEAWGSNVETVAENILNTEIFSYFGSADEFLSREGKNIDFDNNGIVTAQEMDTDGNDNGLLDLQSERDYIITIRTDIQIDENSNGSPDFEVSADIMPPMLYLKRQKW